MAKKPEAPAPREPAQGSVLQRKQFAEGTRVELDVGDDGPEHRSFPRAKVAVPFACWIGEGPERQFSATLTSANVSVSGVFLRSTFFLPTGTQLSLRFRVEKNGDEVEARAEVLRREVGTERADERTGMGLRFLEFFRQTEVTLARLFLGEQLRRFAQQYLASQRARGLESELDRVVDALAAWELLKVMTPGDPWRIG